MNFQSQSNRVIFEHMENILEKMAQENLNIKQLDENVESLITELKTYLQTTLRKSLYRELFVLLHSDKFKGIYEKLDELCHEFKEQYLSKIKRLSKSCQNRIVYKRQTIFRDVQFKSRIKNIANLKHKSQHLQRCRQNLKSDILNSQQISYDQFNKKRIFQVNQCSSIPSQQIVSRWKYVIKIKYSNQRIVNKRNTELFINKVTELKLKLKLDNEKLKEIFSKFQKRITNSKSIINEQFRDMKRINQQNHHQRRYVFSKNTNSLQDIHRKIKFYIIKMFWRNQQSALFSILSKTRGTFQLIAQIIENKIINKNQIIQFFKQTQKTVRNINKYIRNLKEVKCNKHKKTIQIAEKFTSVLSQLLNLPLTERKQVMRVTSQILNNAYKEFRSYFDEQFKYYVETSTLLIRFGVLIAYFNLHNILFNQQIQNKFPIQNSEKYRQLQYNIRIYHEFVKKDIKDQLHSPNQQLFDEKYNIVEINLHGFRKYENKLIIEVMNVVFDECIKKRKNVVLLFLIGSHQQENPDWQYLQIHKSVKEQMNKWKMTSKVKLSLEPNDSSNEHFLTYIRPYFYLIIEVKEIQNIETIYPKLTYTRKGCHFSIKQKQESWFRKDYK